MSPDRMQRQRFEYKYLLDEETALRVRSVAGANISLDEASLHQPDLSYRVNSIYLDSPRLYTFWDWVNANRNRFKLRMRFYDSQPGTPVFLEVKRRVCGCILKSRCAIRKTAAECVLDGQIPPRSDIVSTAPSHQVALETFVIMTTLLKARPQALVTYLREAYVDPENEGLRLTMDRQVRITLRSTLDFSLNADRYVQPFGDRVILELKFNDQFPAWFHELVQQFNLTRGAAAKYCEGMAAFLHPEHGNQNARVVNGPLVPEPETRP